MIYARFCNMIMCVLHVHGKCPWSRSPLNAAFVRFFFSTAWPQRSLDTVFNYSVILPVYNIHIIKTSSFSFIDRLLFSHTHGERTRVTSDNAVRLG